MKPKTPDQYILIVQEYDFECTQCKARHPTSAKQCFICGKSDTIKINQIKEKKKKKTSIRGATLTINT